MREIKFRAWDKQENKMYQWSDGQGFERKDVFLHFGTVYAGQPRWILMQYTGLKDKNGKEIYEGDIVRNKDGETYPVEFNFNSFDGRYMVDEWELEVIGNIYEHGDLLK